MGLRTSDIFQILKLVPRDGTNKSLCMMGKQDLEIDWSSLDELVTQYGLYYDLKEFEKNKWKRDIDPCSFFKIFGFSEVHAADISSYEGADIILDLNQKLPADLYQRFDCVVDGGTLEHVFDVATAIKNMANMVKKGGYIIHSNPVAGWINHGLYSFSPDLYSLFYQANGFEIKELELHFLNYGSTRNRYTYFASSLDCRMISDDINKYIFDMQRISGNEYMKALIWCSAQKKDGTIANINPVQAFDDGVRQLTPDWKENAIRFLQENQGKEIILYGEGYYCDQLLNELFKNDLEHCVKCIFDSSPYKAGTMHRGYRIFCPSKAKLRSADIILISNVKYEKEIYSALSEFGTDIVKKTYTLTQIASF